MKRMEYALLFTIAAILAGSFTGAAVTVYRMNLSILRLETDLDGLSERVRAAQTRDAAKSRWSKKELEENALASQFARNKPQPRPEDGPFAEFWPPTN